MNSYSHNFAVCIGRQLGSGGRNVALAISRKMGIAFYDKEIINQAAKDSGLDPEYFEKVDEKPTIPILGGLAGVHIPFFSGGYLDTESYLGNNNLFKIQSRTVEMLADKGPGVFVGRCADYILRDRPRVLSVFITHHPGGGRGPDQGVRPQACRVLQLLHLQEVGRLFFIRPVSEHLPLR